MSVVDTAYGSVNGIAREGVHAFRGIPYAAAPDGGRRFRPPERPASWEGVRPSRFGDVVRQARAQGQFGDLFLPPNPQGSDCLNLNVWTPDPGAAGLPVLVWIHGGAFVIGSGSDGVYDGTTFARNGVVAVTINYRLGVDGFLHTGPSYEGSGNFGMLDQIAALEWVQENIAAFGGNPAQVTIAGESAGGMSVGTLLAMPKARGLFRRAIPQSGAGHNGITTDGANAVAAELFRMLGLEKGDVGGLIASPYQRVLDAQSAITEDLAVSTDADKYGDLIASTARMAWQPLIGLDEVPKRPVDAVSSASAAGVDLLVGCTADEYHLFLGIDPAALGIDASMVDALYDAVFGSAGKDGSAALEQYRKSRPDASDLDLLAAMQTDQVFRIPAIRLAEAQLANHPDVWMYRLSWPSPAFDGAIKAGHATDIPFMFDNLDDELARALIGDSAPQSLADEMHGAWVSFIKGDGPGHAGIPAWPRYDIVDRPTMDFDDGTTKIVNDPDDSERRLWDGVL